MNSQNRHFRTIHDYEHYLDELDECIRISGDNVVCKFDHTYKISIPSCITKTQALYQAKALSLQLLENQEDVSVDYVAEQFLRILPYHRHLDKEYKKLHKVDFAIGKEVSKFTELCHTDGQVSFDLVSDSNVPVVSFCCPTAEQGQSQGILVRRSHLLYFPVYRVSTFINQVTIKKTSQYLIFETSEPMVWQVEKESEEDESSSDYEMQSTRLLIESTLDRKAAMEFAGQLKSINKHTSIYFE